MKKHIVISPRDGSDFSMDLIFAGLVRKFGIENVIDWPNREKHRRGLPRLTGDHERDYGLERGALCYVEGCETLREWSRPEIIREMWKDGIGYVFMDETDEAYNSYMELFGIISKPVEVVIVAGHDRLRRSIEFIRGRFGPLLRAIFVDDWQPEYDRASGVHLINLSCNFDHLWDVQNRDKYLADKRYEICFVGYNSNRIRKEVVDWVNKRWGHLDNCIIFEERRDKFDMFVRHDEMFRMMAQSKVCLNLPGASACGRALRFYEIPYVGSMMLSMRFPAKLLDAPVEDVHCAYFDDGESLDQSLGQYLEDDNLRDATAMMGHDFFMEKHSVDARMDYIFKVLEG